MADFKLAWALTLVHEGGFTDNENDNGNWTGGHKGVGELKGTKYGISAHSFPDLDIKNLTPEDAGKIYLEKYWNPLYNQIEEQVIANKLFDFSVLMGVNTAVRLLQEVLQTGFQIQADGGFGPITLSAINKSDVVSLLKSYKTHLASHVLAIAANNPNDRQFVNGWLKRINS